MQEQNKKKERSIRTQKTTRKTQTKAKGLQEKNDYKKETKEQKKKE